MCMSGPRIVQAPPPPPPPAAPPVLQQAAPMSASLDSATQTQRKRAGLKKYSIQTDSNNGVGEGRSSAPKLGGIPTKV